MTKIEWTQKTWNPVTGCTKCSPGCENCYAEKMARRLAGRCAYPYKHPFQPGWTHSRRWDDPLRWKKPCKIFVCSMGDLFHEDVPFPIIDEVIERIKLTPRHTYQILTKRPKRAFAYLDSTNSRYFPSNTWFGVTVCNQAEADEKIPVLLQIPATVRFVSVEPMLEAINLNLQNRICPECGNRESVHVYGISPECRQCSNRDCLQEWFPDVDYGKNLAGIHWVICGGETGANARPMNPDWARALRDQCKECGVPFFFKQMTKRQPIPDDLLIREFPKGGND